MTKSSLSQAELKHALHYDPSTGIFTWIKSGQGRTVGSVAGSVNRNRYRRITINRKLLLAHRLAWLYVYGEWPTGDIDHLNGLRDDNRIINLRDVSRIVNCRNAKKPKTNTSGITGVYWHKRHKNWHAYIRSNGKNVHLGCFACKYRAASVRHLAMEIEGGYTVRHGV